MHLVRTFSLTMSFVFLTLSLIGCAGSRVPANLETVPVGFYSTTFGRLALTAPRPGGAVEGRYQLDEGRVAGRYTDGVLKGVWVETGTSGECAPDEFGNTFYGPFTFVFEADGSRFDGTWGRCDGAENEEWTGKYTGPLPDGILYFDATPGVPPMSVPPGAEPPAGVYVTGKGDLTILPPDAQNRFMGRFDGIDATEMLVGTFEAGVLDGTWFDPEAEGPCAPSEQGWTQYGSFRLELRDGGSAAILRGTRGLCDGPMNETWGGLRQ